MPWIESDRAQLHRSFVDVRQASLRMCQGLEPSDYRVQPREEVSPPWWNLGHTSWFFARNVLALHGGQYIEQDRNYDFLLNSYYASLGSRVARWRRGNLTRPTTEDIYAYRRSVDDRVEALIDSIDEDRLPELAALLWIGINHEQQHQELFYTEIKAILFENPPDFRPSYRDMTALGPIPEGSDTACFDRSTWLPVEGGLFEFGHREGGWCWDNELPVHKAYLEGFEMADRLTTCGEYLEFIEDGGYERQLLWLDNGWAAAQSAEWKAPLYWEKGDECWRIFTLSGAQPVNRDEPVCHLSFYEADAFARWKSETFSEFEGARLPSEYEWEHSARHLLPTAESANLLSARRLHPSPACRANGAIRQMIGDAWEWTSSYYAPYPGYRAYEGTLAEYNGKFMDNQRVLRGGSCLTEPNHIRLSYRNFWSASTRFQSTGVRLARQR